MNAWINRFLKVPPTSFFLFGPRGTGKSSWLKHHFKDASVIDLLSLDTSRNLTSHPERLKSIVNGSHQNVFVLDEIQRVPELLTVVHQLIEEDKKRQFILTGSSSRKLKRAGVDMLAGRALLTFCHPFMASELGKAFNLDNALRKGLIPLVLDAPDPDAALRTYLALYVREEVQVEGLVRNIGPFSRFLESVSFSHGSLLNATEVARECHVSRNTAEGYLSILEDLLLAIRLPVFAKRAKRQLVAHSKFYYFDAGVFRSIRPTGPFDRAAEIDGAALEGLVLQNLRAWNDYSEIPHQLFFWRTQSGQEVDFVVYGESEFVAMEVKNNNKVSSHDLRPLKAFLTDYPESRALLLYRGDTSLLIDGILCLPCELFLKELLPGQPLPDRKWRA